MKALILAAGVGSRLGDITKDLPKCLVPVAGKPMIEYQIDALQNQGITNFVLVLGHHGEKIKGFISSKQKYKKLDFTFAENPEYATTNSSYSWLQAYPHVKDNSYLHFNCDIIFFSDLLEKLIKTPYDNVLLVDKNVKLDASMEQVVLEGERIKFMDKANLPNAIGRGSGMAKLSPSGAKFMLERLQQHLLDGYKNQHCHGLMRYALTKVPFYALDPGKSLLCEINTSQELKEAEEVIGRYKP